MDKRLYIFRGIPGSGKSTLANTVASLVVEPDMFRYNENHEYEFDSAENAAVMQKADDLLEYAMRHLGVRCLAIAATHVKVDHFRKFAVLGKKYGYDVTVVECYGQYGNVHGVPDSVVARMRKEFEPLTDDAAREMGVDVRRRDGGDETWIEWRGKRYPTREVCIKGWGLRTVAVESLEDALSGDYGGFSDPEAERIDNGIFFYVADGKIGLPADILAEEIRKEIM